MRLLIAATLSLMTSVPALATVPRVVADMAVTGSLVQMVMGDLGQPVVLLPTGGDVHHYQMRPSQAAALQDAGLIVWVGPQLTPWLAKAAGDDSARLLTLLQTPGTHRQDFGSAHADEGGDGHDEDHDHGDGDDHDHDHDHSGVDPHAWLDPENGRVWVDAIAEALAKLDPDNAPAYRANAQAACAQIDSAEQEAAVQLKDLSGRDYIVFHDAYGYFSDHFTLRPALAVAWGDAAAPSARQLSDLRATIAGGDVACAFPEANHDPSLVKTVIDGSGVRLGGALDPSGSSLPQGASLYPDILRGMAGTIAACMKK